MKYFSKRFITTLNFFATIVWGELKCAEDVLSLVPHDVEQGIYLFFRLRAYA